MARNKTKKPGQKPSAVRNGLFQYPLGGAIFGIAILAAAVFFALSRFSSLDLWGIAFPSYVLGTDYYILAGAAALGILYALLKSAAGNTTRRVKPAVYWLSAVAVMGGGIWIIRSFPVAFAFLGDGAIYLGDVYRVVTQPGYEPGVIKATTYLSGLAIVWSAEIFNVQNATIPFIITGLASFILLFGGMAFFLRHERWPVAVLWLILILGSGGMLLFFGYVELYALGFAFAGLYLLSSWQFFRGELHAAVPGVLLVSAILATASNIILLPSYLLLLHYRFRGHVGKPSLNIAAVVLAISPFAVLVLLYGVFGLGGGNPYLIPATSTELIEGGTTYGTQTYTLFSLVHLIDIPNALMLAAGLAMPMLLIIVFGARHLDWQHPLLLFGVVTLSGGLALVLAGNTTFGMARDWDIMAVSGLCIIFLAVTALTQLWEAEKLPLIHIIPLLAVLAITPAYYWVKVNAEPLPSAERFTGLVERYDEYVTPAYTYNALENLRKFYFSQRMTKKYTNTLLKMGATGYNMRSSYRELIGALKSPEAAAYARESFDAMLNIVLSLAKAGVPASDYRYIPEKELRQFTIQALLGAKETGLPGLAEAYIPRFRKAFGNWPEFAMYRAYEYPPTAREERYEAIRKLDTTELTEITLLIRAANIARNAKQFREAAGLYERALEIDPHQYQQVYISLAEVYYRGLQDRESTIDALQRCINNCIGSTAAETAKEILGRLRGQR